MTTFKMPTTSANGFPCKICGTKAISFHYGACDKCTEEAVQMLVAAKAGKA